MLFGPTPLLLPILLSKPAPPLLPTLALEPRRQLSRSRPLSRSQRWLPVEGPVVIAPLEPTLGPTVPLPGVVDVWANEALATPISATAAAPSACLFMIFLL